MAAGISQFSLLATLLGLALGQNQTDCISGNCDDVQLLQRHLKNPTGTEVETDVGKCSPFSRDSWSSNKVTNDAINVGIEGLKMSLMAYMKEIPGCADSDKDVYGDDFPGLASWTDQFSEYQEFREDEEKIDGDGAFAFVGKFNSITVVGFAGTTFALNKDLFDDLSSGIGTIDQKFGDKTYKIGMGFWREYNVLNTKGLKDKVTAMAKETNNKIICVGHSLGGALANICAVDYANSIGASVILRTYGAPRVFDTDSVKDIQSDLIKPSPSYGVEFTDGKGIVSQRWVMYGDAVPTVPHCSAGYYHMGNGGIDLYDGSLREVGAWGFQHTDFTPWQNGFSAGNHVLTAYYQRMKDCLK